MHMTSGSANLGNFFSCFAPSPSMQTRSSNSPPTFQAGLDQDGTKAHWDEHEEAFLLEHLLLEAKASHTNGFRDAHFHAAADALNKNALKNNSRRGPEKGVKSCKTKWGNVRISSVHVLTVS
jgi:hypothetical protein